MGDVPVPDDSNAYTYPTMGTNSDAPTAKVYGNFKCPYTQGFVSGNLEAIIDEFVATGRLNLQFYNLAYEPGSTAEYMISSSDPRLAAVGLGIWDEDPDSYWQFFAETFDDMPRGYVDFDDLAARVESAGVANVGGIVERAESGTYDGAVEQVAAAAGDDGVTFTPTLELAGDTAAPHHGTQAILDWIDDRVGDAPSGTAGVSESVEPDEPDATDDEPAEDASDEGDDGTDVDDSDETDESEPGDSGTDELETDDSGDDESESNDADDDQSETNTSGEDEFEWVDDPVEPTADGATETAGECTS